MKKATFFSFLLVLILISKAFSFDLLSLNIVKVSNTRETIIMRFDNLKNYKYIRLANDYFYIGLENCNIKPQLTPNYNIEKIIKKQVQNQTRIYFRINQDNIYDISISKPNNKTLLINLTLKNNNNQSNTQETILNEYKNKTKEKKPPLIITSPVGPAYFNPKNITIVLDPGHGGKDSGAVGVNKLQEKVVVLEIAKDMADILKEKGFNVVLTRDNDTFIPLAQRVKIANDANAKIFISIHANASPDPSARGMEVFFLNATSSQKALRIAALENDVPLEQMGTINKIIISLINQAKLKESAQLARDVDDSMYKSLQDVYPHLVNRGIDQAPFYVLVGTNCPSILVETLFITNPKDNNYLASTDSQKKIADGVANGIIAYLNSKKN